MASGDPAYLVAQINTNTTKKDGNVGGEKYVCDPAGCPKDSHFTVLGFTAASGEICAIIFAAK
jgi:hypothetical protein